MIDTAVSNFNALESNNTSNIWFEKGDELANLGSYTEALAQLDQAVSFQADNNAAWVSRAVVLIHLQRYSEALASCERALEIDNSDRQAWLFRGAALNHLGRYKDCYASYDKAMGVERLTLRQRLVQMYNRITKIVLDLTAVLIIPSIILEIPFQLCTFQLSRQLEILEVAQRNEEIEQ